MAYYLLSYLSIHCTYAKYFICSTQNKVFKTFNFVVKIIKQHTSPSSVCLFCWISHRGTELTNQSASIADSRVMFKSDPAQIKVTRPFKHLPVTYLAAAVTYLFLSPDFMPLICQTVTQHNGYFFHNTTKIKITQIQFLLEKRFNPADNYKIISLVQ